MAQSIEVILAPDLYQFHRKCGNVVLIDVARFTSTMVTALANGALSVEAYPDEETPLRLKREQGYVIAGERKGEDIEGFDFNNSPLCMTPENVAGKRLAFCTTNGTFTRSIIYDFDTILAASFLNCNAVCKRLLEDGKSVSLVCSGRRRKPAIEDILLAGRIAKYLLDNGDYTYREDAVSIALTLYNMAKDDVKAFTLDSSPAMVEFKEAHGQYSRDIDFLFDNTDRYDIVPEETKAFTFEVAGSI